MTRLSSALPASRAHERRRETNARETRPWSRSPKDSASKAPPSLAGWLVWTLQDFAVIPTFQGGSIRQALPSLRLVRGVNQKGLFTYGGTPKPASFAVVRRLSR